MAQPRVLVVGCGGIGGIVTAHLSDLGVDVCALSRNTAVVRSVVERGFLVRGEGGRRAIPGRVVAQMPEGPFDYVLLAMQPTDVEAAAREAAPQLASDGRVVCFQNGLCEERVAQIVGAERVVGGIVAWGGLMVEPGVYDRTSAGGFTLGRLEGPKDAQLERLGTLLECVGPVRLSDNLAGARWSKLALNCAVSSLGTLNGTPLGKVVRQRKARRLALEIMSEVVAVAGRAGVKLEKVAGTLDLDWIALSPDDRAPVMASKQLMILAVGARYRRMKSSMLRAIEAGREPSVDFVNGEVVARGRRYEVPTPVNQAVCDRVWALSRGEIKPGRALIEDLFAATR